MRVWLKPTACASMPWASVPRRGASVDSDGCSLYARLYEDALAVAQITGADFFTPARRESSRTLQPLPSYPHPIVAREGPMPRHPARTSCRRGGRRLLDWRRNRTDHAGYPLSGPPVPIAVPPFIVSGDPAVPAHRRRGRNGFRRDRRRLHNHYAVAFHNGLLLDHYAFAFDGGLLLDDRLFAHDLTREARR